MILANLLADIGAFDQVVEVSLFMETPAHHAQINRERVGSFQLAEEGGYRDVALLQDCEAAVWRVCELCGWSLALEQLTGRKRTDQEATTKCHYS